MRKIQETRVDHFSKEDTPCWSISNVPFRVFKKFEKSNGCKSLIPDVEAILIQPIIF